MHQCCCCRESRTRNIVHCLPIWHQFFFPHSSASPQSPPLSLSFFGRYILAPRVPLPQLSRLCLYSTLLPNKRHGTISPKPNARTWTCGASKQRLVFSIFALFFLFNWMSFMTFMQDFFFFYFTTPWSIIPFSSSAVPYAFSWAVH